MSGLNLKKRLPRAGAKKPLSGPGGNSGREKEKNRCEGFALRGGAEGPENARKDWAREAHFDP